MKKIIKIAAGLILATIASHGWAQTTVNICTGSNTVITAVNSIGLSSPSYSMNPGNITSAGPAFTVSPASTVVYTLYVTGTNSNSAVVTTSNTVAVQVSGVTYSLTSPTAFTLGCGVASVCPVVINAQTTPLAGGAITYSFIAPGSSTPVVTFTNNYMANITAPGTWSVVIYDLANACVYGSTFNVTAANAYPVIGNVVVTQNPLSCNVTTASLYPAPNPSLQFSWSYSGPTGSVTVSNPTLVVSTSTDVTQSIALSPTLTAMDLNNFCVSSTVVTIYQNLYQPNALISGGLIPVPCQTIQLTNNSTTTIPPSTGFPTNSIIASSWAGPPPQPTVANSATYIALTTGIYTMTATDLNNGCVQTATVFLDAGPVAAFTHTVTSGVAAFNDVSLYTTTNTAYFWDFGDGNTSTQQNPTHTYVSGGAHLVTFKVTRPGFLCRDSVMQSVNVSGIPCIANSGFSMVPTATVQNWDIVPAYPWNVTAASWSWGDGSTSNTLYGSHQYSVAGMYNICLSVTVSCAATSSTCTSYSIYRMSSQAAQILEVNVIAPALVSGLAIVEADGQLSWNIVPNPNAGEFNLNLDNAKSEPVRIVICDLTGRMVHDQMIESNSTSASVHTGDLPPGMYLVRLETNTVKVTKRMIVSH